jgi:hypothetical protein
MADGARPDDPQEWVVWNGDYGVVATATVGRIEAGKDGRNAWMAPPFEMLGPFNLDELERSGRIGFAACVVLSRQRWQTDQEALRRASHEKRRAAHQRQHEEHARFGDAHRRHRNFRPAVDEKPHREALNLPIHGKLEPTQIKAAFRRQAQKAHPDLGGSHEQFLRVAEARNVLLGSQGLPGS